MLELCEVHSQLTLSSTAGSSHPITADLPMAHLPLQNSTKHTRHFFNA